jgi:type III restriction protein res subunit
MKPINKKYYLSLDKIPNEELYKASLDILNKGIRDDVISTTIERKTSVENSGILLKEATSGYYVLDESIPYGEFLKQVQVATGLPIVMHKALCDYNRTNTLDKAFFNRNTLTKFILDFQLWFKKAFLKRFSYKALNVESRETALTDINGEVKEKKYREEWELLETIVSLFLRIFCLIR